METSVSRVWRLGGVRAGGRYRAATVRWRRYGVSEAHGMNKFRRNLTGAKK